jgi:hypothetical protein
MMLDMANATEMRWTAPIAEWKASGLDVAEPPLSPGPIFRGSWRRPTHDDRVGAGREVYDPTPGMVVVENDLWQVSWTVGQPGYRCTLPCRAGLTTCASRRIGSRFFELRADDPRWRLGSDQTVQPRSPWSVGGDGGRTILEYLFGQAPEAAYTGGGKRDTAQRGEIADVEWAVGTRGPADCDQFLQSTRSRYLRLAGKVRQTEGRGRTANPASNAAFSSAMARSVSGEVASGALVESRLVVTIGERELSICIGNLRCGCRPREASRFTAAQWLASGPCGRRRRPARGRGSRRDGAFCRRAG